jgi:translation initiation factor 2B subunit (eIF-2B alpha/beta/delta family)
MKSPAHSPAKGSDNFSARIDLRVNPKFKKTFNSFCKDSQISASDVAREALGQYMSLGDFKKQLFEFLHKYTNARKKFREFLVETFPSNEMGNWFEDLLGSEEIKLIKNTPVILLSSIQDTILTSSGEKVLRERMRCQK